MSLAAHLAGLPSDLADALEGTYEDAVKHFLCSEFDDAQVDAGRFCEAALRYLQFKMKGEFTPIDGTQKPDRKRTVQDAKDDTSLDPESTLRKQVPQAIELVMDFRNSRNSAHLGSLDANYTDASCVIQNTSWIVAEIARIESQDTPDSIQALIDQLSRRHVPLVQVVGDRPVILDATMSARDEVLVFLYHAGRAVGMKELFSWASYSNSTRFRTQILAGLVNQKFIIVGDNGMVDILIPGENEAQGVILERSDAIQ